MGKHDGEGKAGKELLVMGATGSGKSMLIKRLTLKCQGQSQPLIIATTPTIGVEPQKVTYDHHSFTVREIGGEMGTEWPSLFSLTTALVFIVDVSDSMRMATAAVTLLDLVNEIRLANRPFLIVLNKVDMPNAIPRGQVDAVMRLADLIREHPGKMSVIEASLVTGRGVQEILDWAMAEMFMDSRKR